MTSNAGSNINTNGIGFGKDTVIYNEERVKNSLQEVFRPEFLNRVDEIISFDSLTKEQLLQIVDLMLNDTKNVLLEKPLGAETFSEGIKVAPRTLCAEYLKRPWEIGGAKENISDAVNSQVPVHMFIRFEEEDVYHMGYLDRPYDDIVGFYEMGGNTVKLRPPVNKNFPLYNLMFPAGTEQVLIYNFDYPDFYDVGVLYNDNIVLRSHFNIRNKESSEKLILDGVEVFAEAEKNITVSENMGLRSRPSVQEGKIKSFMELTNSDKPLKNKLRIFFNKLVRYLVL